MVAARKPAEKLFEKIFARANFCVFLFVDCVESRSDESLCCAINCRESSPTSGRTGKYNYLILACCAAKTTELVANYLLSLHGKNCETL